MAESDIAMKQYMSAKHRFADFFNVFTFGGRQIIKPDQLTTVDSESGIIAWCNKVIERNLAGMSKSEIQTAKRTLWRHRDIIMEWNNGTYLSLLACETQDKVHYAMPVRNILYDALSYTDQMRQIWDNLTKEEKKDITDGEFFSRFRKQDKIVPVITTVFHYGEDKWDGNCSLYDMFDSSCSDDYDYIHKFVPDYKINLVDINKIDNLSLFRSDLGLVFGLVQCRDSKEKTRQFANEHKDFFEAVDYETMTAISVMTNGGDKFARLMGDGKKVYNMCKAYQEMYEEGVEHGWNNGRNDGIRKSIILLRNVGTADDLIANMIMSEYNISAEEVQAFMNAVTNI